MERDEDEHVCPGNLRRGMGYYISPSLSYLLSSQDDHPALLDVYLASKYTQYVSEIQAGYFMNTR